MNTVSDDKRASPVKGLFLVLDSNEIIKVFSRNLQDLFPEFELQGKKLGEVFDHKFEDELVSLTPKLGLNKSEKLVGHFYRNADNIVLELEVSLLDQNNYSTIDDLKKFVDSYNRFLITTTHELKSPISVLLASSEMLELLLQDLKVEKPEVEKCFNSIKESGHYLSSMVDDLMDIGRFVNRKIPLRPQRIDVTKVIKRIAYDIKVSLQKYGCDLSVEGPNQLEAIVDPLRFEQAITNLVINACKYGNKRPVKIKISSKGQKAIISIKDQGIGIAEEDHGKIFRQFGRSTELHHKKSFGIGLFIVKSIVEAHKGEIELESQINKGSTFTLSFPLKP